jgi:hypothetical protein
MPHQAGKVKTRTNFSFRIDIWTADGESIVEHVAGVEDYQVALADHVPAGRARDRRQLAPAPGPLG